MDDSELADLKKEVLKRLDALDSHMGEETYEARRDALNAAMDGLLAAEAARRLAFR